MSQTERLYWIDAQIRANRYPNAQQVSEHFGVTKRTAYADRDHLIHHLNAPLVYDRQRGGWKYTDTTYVLPFLALSEPEAAALRRSLLAAQEYLSESDAHPVRLLFERLAPYLSAPATPESIGGSIHFTPEAAVAPELMETCRRAIRNRHRLRLRYYSAHRDAETERIVRPYHLHNFQGEWHLIGWCEWREDFRQFFLGRIRAYELLEPDATFVRDPQFEVDRYLKQGLGLQHGQEPVQVRVRFSPRQARWIRERRYHASQQTEELPDGGLIVTLQVAGTEEVARWLLSYGAEAEALEPPALRAEIARQVKNLAKIYGPSDE
jgi:predicted DNA-binding transcriptional regulator YafY